MATGVLEIEPIDGPDGTRFRGSALGSTSARMFGGHAVALAILAAGRTVTRSRILTSVHAAMMRPGDAAVDCDFHVAVDRDGRAFSARRVEVLQSGRMLAQVSTQWHEPEDCSMTFVDTEPPPAVPVQQPLPYPAPGVATDAFDLRWADDGPGRVLWFRLKAPPPPDPLVHAALAVYITDLWLADTAVRRIGKRFDDPTVRASTLEHSVWLHGPVALTGWSYLRSVARSAQQGLAVVTADLRTETGDALATVVQAVSMRDRPTRTPTTETTRRHP